MNGNFHSLPYHHLYGEWKMKLAFPLAMKWKFPSISYLMAFLKPDPVTINLKDIDDQPEWHPGK